MHLKPCIDWKMIICQVSTDSSEYFMAIMRTIVFMAFSSNGWNLHEKNPKQ